MYNLPHPTQWVAYNKVGSRIDIRGRAAEIIGVHPPLIWPEVERIEVRYDDTKETETLPVNGVRIGSDRIR